MRRRLTPPTQLWILKPTPGGAVMESAQSLTHLSRNRWRIRNF